MPVAPQRGLHFLGLGILDKPSFVTVAGKGGVSPKYLHLLAFDSARNDITKIKVCWNTTSFTTVSKWMSRGGPFSNSMGTEHFFDFTWQVLEMPINWREAKTSWLTLHRRNGSLTGGHTFCLRHRRASEQASDKHAATRKRIHARATWCDSTVSIRNTVDGRNPAPPGMYKTL